MQRHISPTPGERLLIWRRRNGTSIPEACTIFETSKTIIKKWEQGERHDVPYVELYMLQAWERCFLVRYRNRISLVTMAITMGVHRDTITHWERGRKDWTKLADYWQSAGWKINNKYYV